MTWLSFLEMGGYGTYIWSAYSLSAVVLIWNIITPLLRQREVNRKLARWFRQEEQSS